MIFRPQDTNKLGSNMRQEDFLNMARKVYGHILHNIEQTIRQGLYNADSQESCRSLCSSLLCDPKEPNKVLGEI